VPPHTVSVRPSTARQVGTDGGTVYRCMFSHNAQMETEFTKVAGEGKVPKLRSPVRSEFGGHSGPVHAVDCSPFQVKYVCS